MAFMNSHHFQTSKTITKWVDRRRNRGALTWSWKMINTKLKHNWMLNYYQIYCPYSLAFPTGSLIFETFSNKNVSLWRRFFLLSLSRSTFGTIVSSLFILFSYFAACPSVLLSRTLDYFLSGDGDVGWSLVWSTSKENRFLEFTPKWQQSWLRFSPFQIR